MTVLEYAIGRLYGAKSLAEVQLEIVEGDGNLADLQGFIAGVKIVINALKENGFIFDIYDKVTAIETFSDDEILEFSYEIVEIRSNTNWTEFLNALNEQIAKKKDFLFYEAKKGRDLAFVQGWRKAVFFIDEVFQAIEEKAEELKKAPTFSF